MKKMKKILAFALAMVMMFAMNVTVFGANATSTIKVTGLASTGTNTVQYVKVLEPNVKSATGYDFVNGMKFAKDENSDYTVAEFLKLDGAALQAAVATIDFTDAATMTVEGTTASATVDAGLYAVKATNAAPEGDPAIVYNYMVIEVEYDKATLKNDGTYEYNVSKTGSAVAKYTTIPVTKVATDEDKIVSIGTTQTYTITTYMPSDVEFFTLTDTLTGADYLINEKHPVNITVGSNNNVGSSSLNNNGQQLVVSFTKEEATANAGQQIVVTYDVTVTDYVVNNTVVPADGKHEFKPASETLYTGGIELTKVAYEKDENGNDVYLANAVFNVLSGETVLKFTLTDGVYKLDPNGSENVTTGADGKFVVDGLDLGTYTLKEVQAPQGYTIADEVEVTVEEANTRATENYANAAVTVTDTKLSALPATGGIGTTIFTIAGVAIMVIAAGLFFATRRKNAR